MSSDSRGEPVEVQSRTDGEKGLQGALERFAAAQAANSLSGQWIALVEALAWTAALDEWHHRHLKGRGYRAKRDADRDGKVIRGLYWARNRGLHQLKSLVK